jgi:hypothetical protein
VQLSKNDPSLVHPSHHHSKLERAIIPNMKAKSGYTAKEPFKPAFGEFGGSFLFENGFVSLLK